MHLKPLYALECATLSRKTWNCDARGRMLWMVGRKRDMPRTLMRSSAQNPVSCDPPATLPMYLQDTTGRGIQVQYCEKHTVC